MTGIFYGVGVGPGDPELLTLKAQKVLAEVDIICVPVSRREKDSLALAVVKVALDKDIELLELEFPMSKDKEVLETSWHKAGETVAERLLAGSSVAFITIGDPTLYSTYTYLLGYLKSRHADLETITIPGVTSITACSALIQEPLVEGDEKLAVIPAAYNLEDLSRVMEIFDTVVLMKVHRRLPELMPYLRRLGDVDAYYVSRCGYPDQFFTNKPEEVVEQDTDYMSLLIVKRRRGNE